MTTNHTPDHAFYVPNRAAAPDDYRLEHMGCAESGPTFTNPAGYCCACGAFVGVVAIMPTLPADLNPGDIVAGSLCDGVVEHMNVTPYGSHVMAWRRLGNAVGEGVRSVELASAQPLRVVTVSTVERATARNIARDGLAWPHGLD